MKHLTHKRSRKAILLLIIVGCLAISGHFAFKHRDDIKGLVHKGKLEINAWKKADIEFLNTLDLPVVILETENGIEPTFTIDPSPTGWGTGIKDNEYVNMKFSISLHDSLIFPNALDTYNNSYDDSARIRVRGNTSALNDKKSYKLKFSNKVDLLNRGEDDFSDKNWILLRIYNIKSAIGLETNRLLGLPYAASSL
jgi:hypothetical protein